MQLKNKKILLGISGGIAAYKGPELVRRLREQGADVRVVLTQSAKAFVTPLSLQAVSGHMVSDSMLEPESEAGINHIELARWADLVLIAPASANLMARMAMGMADELLPTLCLATPSPVAVAPAMNQQMYSHPATQHNIEILRQRGVTIWGPASGEQACGDYGPGRMLDVPELVSEVCQYFSSGALNGVRLLLTAGPTREGIDPVRFLSNHSSGKMGFALAQAAIAAGAEVELIAGPVNLPTPPGVTRINVESAEQMKQEVLSRSAQADIFIGCAAVADYRPEQCAEQKMKKDAEQMVIRLVRNPDIISLVAASDNHPFTVGFAAETQDVEQYAVDKMRRKNLDMIAANDVANPELGFNSDQNALAVFWADGKAELPQAGKQQLASQLIALIAKRYKDETDRT
ncbi:bifunctional phosphopantothenoylcysteine decarboxylase/phosphopantothenate--cysteine ligase CoaBC [Dongshaea marina]|uniref:bifunctional phosphopantothenoylcysteine decarboxylase/phosphopantothenate--cysteine ligase CoaBC n=1 Tax=Dongshaea marina TaxID=2047966 RepID=UPI000D3E5340|nr:bifunctional phosphopantothenoylcysteine decarboxylase/phosphopantothenate--cysteine ligase CoaBC [Dongshaea marina]